MTLSERIKDWGGMLVGFLRLVFNNTFDDRCSYIAAGLTVTTMLSLVPLMTVIFSVLSAFPAYATLGQEIQSYVFTHFVPNSGEQIREYLSGFVSQASQLKAVGVGILLATALLLIRTIDKAFNVIWHTEDKRRPIKVFLVYWAVLSLGPIFLGLSIGLTSYFITLPMVSDAFAQIGNIVRTGLPFLLTSIALSLMYWVIPNRRIKIRHAISAGIIAAILFEMAKSGFSFYVTNVPSYQEVFGTLAVLPIFLIWMYLSWMIILFGAEVCHAMEVYNPKPPSVKNRFIIAYHVLGFAWKAFREGKTFDKTSLIELNLADDTALDEVLTVLKQARWLTTVDEERILLSRDLDKISFYEFSRTLPWPVPGPSQFDVDGLLNPGLREILEKAHEAQRANLGTGLVEMYLVE